MSSAIRPLFHHSVAEAVYNEITTRTSRYYYYVGKILDWPDEQAPPLPLNTYDYELETRREIIAAKFISIADVAFVARRIDWISGTVYDQYDDIYSAVIPSASGATSLQNANFYVMTEDFNVYKCISNNYGATSTVKPEGTSTNVVETADGYNWKFMYNVPLALRNKFMNTEYIPVTTSVQNGFYTNGEITGFSILAPGSGYDQETTTITINGDGVDADLEPVITNGELTSVIINDPGEGYTTLTATVNGDGQDAQISVDLSQGDLNTSQSNVELLAINGSINHIEVETEGEAYSDAVVTIDGDGVGASASPVITNGRITAINILSPGSGYTNATVTIVGTGTGASARAIISPVGGHGRNAIKELFATTLCFFSAFDNDLVQGMNIDNDYRQIGILKSPEKFASQALFTSDIGATCFVVEGTFTASDHQVEDILTTTNGSKSFRIVTIEDNKVMLQPIGQVAPVASEVYRNERNANQISATAVTDPTINKFSGTLAFVDNKNAFRERDEQFVYFKTFIKF